MVIQNLYLEINEKCYTKSIHRVQRKYKQNQGEGITLKCGRNIMRRDYKSIDRIYRLGKGLANGIC